jgi:parallel beta-helix repeat protein
MDDDYFTFSFNTTAGWELLFYDDRIDSVDVCDNGFIMLDSQGGCSYNPIGSDDLANRKMIAPYYVDSCCDVTNIYYCTYPSYVVFRWVNQNGYESEAIIYQDGTIKFAYPESSNSYDYADVGVSYGDGSFYSIVIDNDDSIDIDNDYTFTNPATFVSKNIVNTTPGAKPFWTNKSTNPITINLDAGQSELITFWVNATVDYGSYTFFGYANITSNPSNNAVSESINISPRSGTPLSVTLLSPTTAMYQKDLTNLTHNFSCSASLYNIDGLDLVNISLVIWNSSGDIVNFDNISSSGKSITANYTHTFQSVEDSYTWNCLAYDTWGNSIYSNSNNTIGMVKLGNCMALNQSDTTYYLNRDITQGSGSCFNILKNNITLDCGGHLISGTGSYGIYSRYYNFSKIKNCRFSGWDYGAYIKDGKGINISGYSSGNNPSYGSYINNVKESYFSDIMIENTTSYGFYLYETHFNELSNISVSNSTTRNYYIYKAQNNTFSDLSSQYSQDYSLHLYYIHNNVFNNIDISDSKEEGIRLQNSSNNSISGLDIWNTSSAGTYYGLYIYESSNNTLSDGSINKSIYGIYFYSSSGPICSDNKVSDFYIDDITREDVVFKTDNSGSAIE